jgi:hypothetical protein
MIKTTSGSGSVTTSRLLTRLISLRLFADAGFSFTLKKTTEYSDDAWSLGPGTSAEVNMKQTLREGNEATSTFTPTGWRFVG